MAIRSILGSPRPNVTLQSKRRLFSVAPAATAKVKYLYTFTNNPDVGPKVNLGQNVWGNASTNNAAGAIGNATWVDGGNAIAGSPPPATADGSGNLTFNYTNVVVYTGSGAVAPVIGNGNPAAAVHNGLSATVDFCPALNGGNWNLGDQCGINYVSPGYIGSASVSPQWNAYTGAEYSPPTLPPPPPPPPPPPSYILNILSPTNGASVISPVTFSGTAPGFLNVEVSYNGTMLSRATPDSAGNWSVSTPLTGVPTGVQSLVVQAWDAPAGSPNFTHHVTQSISLNVTVPAPSYVLTVTAPANGANVSGSATFSGTAPGFVNVEVSYNNAKLGASITPDGAGNWSGVIPLTSVPVGMDAFTIQAWDVPPGGQANHTATQTLTLNVTAAPAPKPTYVLTVTSPLPGATVTSPVTFAGNASGFVNVEVWWNGAIIPGASTTPDVNFNYSLPVVISSIPSGNQLFTVNAWDVPPGGQAAHSASQQISLNVQGTSPPPPPPSGVGLPTVTQIQTQLNPYGGGAYQLKKAWTFGTASGNTNQSFSSLTNDFQFQFAFNTTTPSPSNPFPGGDTLNGGAEWEKYRSPLNGSAFNQNFQFLSDHMDIVAVAQDAMSGNMLSSVYQYGITSGLLATNPTNTVLASSLTYGYYEIMCQLPNNYGMWPAWWMVGWPYNWPPEIDIFEFYGTGSTGSNPSTNDITVHPHGGSDNTWVPAPVGTGYPYFYSGNFGGWPIGNAATTGYHRYGLLIRRTPGVNGGPNPVTLDGFLDGNQIAHATWNWIGYQGGSPGGSGGNFVNISNMQVYANLAVGGPGTNGFGRAVTAADLPARMSIKYIAYWG